MNRRTDGRTDRVIPNFVCGGYNNNMIWVSFCCLTNRYWSNRKMTSISHNYNIEYMPTLAWYDVAINSTIKTCILLYKFETAVCMSDLMA